ncbi:MAG TPA: hypothetical protein VJ825_03330 [Gemmatimonadaceae bacterium]|nr:hypothetical protein [Gemmatimonadaceae bacterium]
MLHEGVTPLRQLPFRIRRNVRQSFEAGGLRDVLHGLADQRLLGTELPEDRDLVYARGIGDAASGGTPEAVLGKDSSRRGKDFVSFHGPG